MSSQNTREPENGSRTPQRQRGRDRVAGLLAAAAALFVENGFDATTMTEIAMRAGASIGSLYLFFPTKQALAQTMVTSLADEMSGRLDALRSDFAGRSAVAIGDALFAAMSDFHAAHPVYSVLIDTRRDDDWKHAVRARRRSQIAALFGQANPALPSGQAERLAVLVPELMRVTLVLNARLLTEGLGPDLRGDVAEELRSMLRHHLAWPAAPEPGLSSAAAAPPDAPAP